jgi:peptide/nickel transport system substrate-binding protein
MKRLTFVLLLLAALLLVAGCQAAGPAAPAATKVAEPTKVAAPKTLVVCMSQEPDTLYYNGSNMFVTTLALEGAFRDGQGGNETGGYDDRGYDYQPVLFDKLPNVKDGDAKMVKVKVKVGDPIEKDGAVVKADKEVELDQISATFKLKANIKWSDGTALKASDSVFAYKVGLDKDSGATTRYLKERTASYVASDDRTVTWTGIPGFVYPLYNTTFFTPLPEHILKDIAPKDIKASPFGRKPLSYGPYRVTNWISGDRIELEKNPYYFRASEGLPKIDKVIYRFIPDTNQLTAQLIAGQCDIGTQDALNTDAIAALDAAAKAGQLTPYYIPGSTWEHIDFMTQPTKAPKPRPEFFTDVRVRQAVAYATNRKEMVDKILFGKSKVMDVTVPADHWAYPKDDSKVVKYGFDVEKAKKLLDDAGWKVGADGIREKGGQKFSVTISTTAGNKPREAIMQIFQANMKTVGIDVKLDFPPSTVLFGRGKDSDYMSGNFDVILYAWVAGVEPTLLVYTCDQIPNKDNAFANQNNTFWCNKDFDKAYSGFNGNLVRADRLPFAAQAEIIFSQELPALPLYQRVNVMAAGPRVIGFKPDPSADELANIEELDIKQ